MQSHKNGSSQRNGRHNGQDNRRNNSRNNGHDHGQDSCNHDGQAMYAKSNRRGRHNYHRSSSNRKPGTHDKKEKGYGENILCFRCGGKGHMIRQCPSDKRISQGPIGAAMATRAVSQAGWSWIPPMEQSAPPPVQNPPPQQNYTREMLFARRPPDTAHGGTGHSLPKMLTFMASLSDDEENYVEDQQVESDFDYENYVEDLQVETDFDNDDNLDREPEIRYENPIEFCLDSGATHRFVNRMNGLMNVKFSGIRKAFV